MSNEKIADELMSEAELDGVAGGSCYEMADDSRFLNSLNGSVNRYGATRVSFNRHGEINDIEKSWESLGIKFHFASGVCSNLYYKNGKQITRDEAWAHAEKVTGKHLERHQWDW